jgi:trehalose-phosphatase
VTADTLFAPFAEAPERSALILDVDGTLSPIAPRPELAVIPDETRAELRRLAGVYLLVACLSGRAGDDARRLVGVPEVEVVGNHGLELSPHAPAYSERMAYFRDEIGLPVEDKGLTLSYHYREAGNEAAARAELESVAERAAADGLVAGWGRKVLEIRPPVEADKGTAVRELVARAGATGAGLYAGDDATDLDAFAGLRAAGLEHTVCIAVDSLEAPPGLREAADLVVMGSAGMAEVLRRL